MIDIKLLEDQFSSAAGVFQSAEPFPHAVFDNLFDPAILMSIAGEFPKPREMSQRFVGKIEGGKTSESDISNFGPITREFFFWMNSAPVLNALENLTGIQGLIPDPYLSGGGLHQTSSGGCLKIHADFNVHMRLRLVRRLNLLVYLNHDWNPEWGGELELWDGSMSRCVRRVHPGLGAVVVFETSQTSFHGLPEPLRCPNHLTRKSLALYYYTSSESLPEALNTQFRARPGERLEFETVGRLRTTFSHLKKALTTLFRG